MSGAGRSAGDAGRADGGRCVTCSDEALPMDVLEVDEAGGLAACRGAGGERRTVETALLAAVAPGDRVLVHADVAIAHAAERTSA